MPYKNYPQMLPVLPTLPAPFLNYRHPACNPAKPVKTDRNKGTHSA
jgi:hypothetical protein